MRARQWYSPVDPPGDLAGLLACAWTAVPTGRHRLTPDGCADLLRLSSGEIHLCGPETQSWEVELPSGTTAVGIRFRPGAAPRVLGVNAAEISNRIVPLADVVGWRAADALDRRLGKCSDLPSARDELVRWVAEHAGPIRSNDPLAESVLRTLNHSPRVTQADIAAVVGLSVRQLHRRALWSFGYGTSMLARLLRFQRLLGLVDLVGQRDEARRSLASLAAQAGYADQAHLGRECRAITGLTPTAFLAEYFPTFPDMSDPYKTAQSASSTMSS